MFVFLSIFFQENEFELVAEQDRNGRSTHNTAHLWDSVSAFSGETSERPEHDSGSHWAVFRVRLGNPTRWNAQRRRNV